MRRIFTVGLATLIGFVTASVPTVTRAQQPKPLTPPNPGAEAQFRQRAAAQFQMAYALAARNHWPLTIRGKKGSKAILVGVDPKGYPIYRVIDNLQSAQTTSTTALWPGGSSGLNLTGNDASLKGRLAIWDGGAVLGTHIELTGRVNQVDGFSEFDDHATHVSGTMIATGINPQAKGMAFQAPELDAYYYGDAAGDLAQMQAASSTLYLSNHSYGNIAGWYQDADSSNRWEWWGIPGDTVDYKFGYYDPGAQGRDSIAYHAPYYLIVQAASNNRGETGPAVDSAYWEFNTAGTAFQEVAHRPANLSSNAYFQTIPTYGNAKDILTVGAINPIPNGYTQPSDVVMSYFSSWGPTSDGRIKPDVVADGVGVLSCVAESNYAYEEFDGTSMATPNATGSLLLLQQYYTSLHGSTPMLSSTLKALAIHTADQAGTSPGPNYIYGWGLLDAKNAAAVITASVISNPTSMIIQDTLVNSTLDTFMIPVVASGTGPIVATIVWTDPPASVDETNLLATDPKLINDLDLRVINGSNVFEPWILNPASPASAATTGDNHLDNVEKVQVSKVIPGATYYIRVTHKATLARGSQPFSLIISGVGGNTYCASGPTSSSGTKIDSVSFGGVHNGNGPADSCTTYSDYTSLQVGIQGNQTLPLYIALGNCGGGAVANTVINVYMDLQNDGTFTDPGDLVATSPVLSGTNPIFSTNIITPANLKAGVTTRMRIVAEETSNASLVVPCGPYGNGETQDYSVFVNPPANDVAMGVLVDPLSPACADSSQIIVVSVQNLGSKPESNIPVTVQVLNGATVVTTLTGSIPYTIQPDSSVDYALPGSFISVPNATYTINASATLTGDQDTSNNHASYTLQISQAPNPPASASATNCGSNSLVLSVTNPDEASSFFWYTTPTGGTPFAWGFDTTLATYPSASTYYVGSGASFNAPPATRSTLGTGGYNIFDGNYVTYFAAEPMTLESARLYINYPGNIAFVVADVIPSSIESDGSYSYYPYTTNTFYFPATTPNPQYGAVTSPNPTDTGAVFYLNLPLPAGSHQIIVMSLDSASIFRNDDIATNPYPLGSTAQFAWTGNSAGAGVTGDETLYEQYYYFFYDSKLKTADCPSSGRTSVSVSTTASPSITQNGDSLISSAATGNQWYFNGLKLAGDTSSIMVAVEQGNYYTIVANDSTGCSQKSNTIDYTVTAVTTVVPLQGLLVYPNPTNAANPIQLSFTATSVADLTVEVFDVLGQPVYKQVLPGFVGPYSNQINLQGNASGVYLLKITDGTNITVKKILLEH